MAKNYTITFKSLRAGTTYVVNIGGGTGTAVALKGGASPFTTQEDDNEDMFAAVRTQTGYLRIVDDGTAADGVTAFDWHDLIPETDTSRPVTLTKTSGGTTTTCWQGFMQAQDFGNTLYGNPQEREFPVHCVLTVTQGTDINYQQTAIQNFAYLLKQIVDAIPSVQRPTQFVVQGGRDAQTWLLKRIDWQNFVSRNDGAQAARFTCFECLEDMCAFWGWTARTKGTTMYLTAADDSSLTTWLTMTYAQLTTMAGGSAAGSTNGTWDTVSFDTLGDVFASVNNADYVQRGYNKAVVSSDANSADGTVMKAYPGAVEVIMINSGTYTENYDDCYAIFTQNLYSFSTAYLVGTCSNDYGAFCKMLVKKGMSDPGTYYDVIRIRKTFISASQTAFASFETIYHHSFYDTTHENGGFDYGGIEINFDVFRKGVRYADFNNNGVGTKHIYLRVGIGMSRAQALWYNGTTWTSTQFAIPVRIGDQTARSSMLGIVTNHEDMQGKLFVDFLGSDDLSEINGERRFEVVDFSVVFNRRSYHQSFNTSERAGSREYTSTNQNVNVSTYSCDCAYASDNDMEWGYGVLMEPDGKWMGKLTYGNTQEWPEQHLADRVTAYWATSKRRMSVEVRSNLVGDIGPKTKVTVDGTTGHAIAVSREWRDDVTSLTVLQTE